MCLAWSGIATLEGITIAGLGESQSHSRILEQLHLNDDYLVPDFVRLECLCHGKDFFDTNPDHWFIKIDQPLVPRWFAEDFVDCSYPSLGKHSWQITPWGEQLCKEFKEKVISEIQKFNWTFNDQVAFCEMPELIEIPDGIKCRGDLLVIDCPKLTTFPRDIDFDPPFSFYTDSPELAETFPGPGMQCISTQSWPDTNSTRVKTVGRYVSRSRVVDYGMGLSRVFQVAPGRQVIAGQAVAATQNGQVVPVTIKYTQFQVPIWQSKIMKLNGV